jgi:hypothetical protein
MQLTIQQKNKLIQYYPELRDWFELQESKNKTPDTLVMANNLLVSLLNKIQSLRGEDGYTPVKGKDYWTEVEIAEFVDRILKEATPIKGIHYEDGKDYVLTAQDKKDIAKSIKVPIVEKVIERVEVIKEVLPEEIDVSIVKGAVSKKDIENRDKKVLDGMARIDGRIKLIDQRWGGHGGGSSSKSKGISVETPTGDVNGSNVTFTVTNTPLFVVADNLVIIDGFGYTYSAPTITMSSNIPPVQFIRSYYTS